jgi:membrane protein implicated in regulation of membrane protease activity
MSLTRLTTTIAAAAVAAAAAVVAVVAAVLAAVVAAVLACVPLSVVTLSLVRGQVLRRRRTQVPTYLTHNHRRRRRRRRLAVVSDCLLCLRLTFLRGTRRQ